MRLAGILVDICANAGHLENGGEFRVDRAVIVEPLLEAVGIFVCWRCPQPNRAARHTGGIANQRARRNAGIAGRADSCGGGPAHIATGLVGKGTVVAGLGIAAGDVGRSIADAPVAELASAGRRGTGLWFAVQQIRSHDAPATSGRVVLLRGTARVGNADGPGQG